MTESRVTRDGELPAPKGNYRDSHVGEGESYHKKFFEQPYRAVMWEIEQTILRDLLERHCPEPGRARLLDFACGTGRVLGLLEPLVGTAVGVDVSPSMLAVAERGLRRATLHCVDITTNDRLDHARFDVITAFRFFPNAEPELRDAVMAKLSRLLAPGGILVFNNHRRCGSLGHRLQRLLFSLRIKRNPRNMHCMADAEAAELARRHGLVIASQHNYGVLPVLKESRPILPAGLIRAVERRALGRSMAGRATGYTIYVLRRGG